MPTANLTGTFPAANLSGTLAAAQFPALTGDVSNAAGSLATTVGKVNGVSYQSAPATHTVPVITAANTETYKTVPDCQDLSGNHLNYTQSTDSFSCGTTISPITVTTTGTQTLTNKNLVAPQINGTTMSESPTISWGTFIPGNITIVTGVSQLTIPKAITILRFESITYANAAAGCTTNAVLNITDQTAATTLATITLTSQVVDSGPLSINVPAAHIVRTGVATAAAGCTSTPHDAVVEVQYRMQ